MLKANTPRGIHVFFTDDTRKTFKSSLIGGEDEQDDITLNPIDRSKHEGVKDARFGYGKLRTTKGEEGPGVQLYGCIYNDNSYAFELAVLNDMIRNPLGRTFGRLAVLFNGKLIYDSRVRLYDQTGCAFRFGDFKFAPRHDLLDPILKELPNVNIDAATLAQWSRQLPDPDPVHWTHTTGSPRNEFLSKFFSLYKYGQGAPWETRALHDFVLAQIGMKANGEDRFIDGRPHWLTDYDTGQIYDYDVFYNIDGNSKYPEFGENGILAGPYSDSFGRRALMQLDPTLIQRGTRTGYDIEHLEVEKSFAAAVLLGSEFAYRDVELIAQQQLEKGWEETGIYSPSFFHSSRTMGWGPRAIERAYQLTGKDKYLRAYREILRNCFSGEWPAKLSRDYSKDDFPLPWIQSRSSMYVNTGWNPVEACWQAAVAGSSCWLAASIDPDPNWKRKFEEWALYAANCIAYCFSENGIFENYGFNLKDEHGLPAYRDGYLTWSGTRFWILDCLTRAFLLTGDNKYGNIVKRHWSALKDYVSSGKYVFRPGGDGYHCWTWMTANYIDKHEV